jgi:hypothetical protein
MPGHGDGDRGCAKQADPDAADPIATQRFAGSAARKQPALAICNQEAAQPYKLERFRILAIFGSRKTSVRERTRGMKRRYRHRRIREN